MSDLLPFAVRPRTLEDSDLAADLKRDLGAETLFFICAIEAALGIEFEDADLEAAQSDDVGREVVQVDESEQLNIAPLEEAA